MVVAAMAAQVLSYTKKRGRLKQCLFKLMSKEKLLNLLHVACSGWLLTCGPALAEPSKVGPSIAFWPFGGDTITKAQIEDLL
jgi:hypothetical protein